MSSVLREGMGEAEVTIIYPPTREVINQMKALLVLLPSCHTTKDAEEAEKKFHALMFYMETINRIARYFMGQPVKIIFHLGTEAEKFFLDMGKLVVDLEARTGIHDLLAQTLIASGSPLPEHDGFDFGDGNMDDGGLAFYCRFKTLPRGGSSAPGFRH